MKKKLLFLLLALPLTASAGTHKIVYEIPAPEALKPFSRFEVVYTAKKQKDGLTELSYKLPSLLLGQETEFRFTGEVDFNAASFELKAPSAEMECKPSVDHAICRVEYRGVPVDLDGVRDTLEAMPITPAEKLGRFELASMVARSGGDFAGILYFVRDPEYHLGE
jgi:hypothetical protein